MSKHKPYWNLTDLRMPYFMASFDYGFGQFGLGSYLYDHNTMKVILFIPDEEDKTFPFHIKHVLFPKPSN